jgi:uncharacterized protein (TIGR02147 family)
MPNIFLYIDYRTFIKDWYEEKRGFAEPLTYRKVCLAVGFNSPGHFTMVLQGKTNLSPSAVKKFSDMMRLKKREAAYFELLVQYNQAKLSSAKKAFFDKMIKFKEIGTTLLSPDQYEYYQKWYYAVIHDILSFYRFSDDYSALAKMVVPSITPREAKKAIELLERMGFIVKNSEGVFECRYPAVSAYAEGRSLALSVYAKEMMDRAKWALEKIATEERSISWAGFSMSRKTYEVIKMETRAFRKKIIALAKADPDPEQAYHLNIQLFPVSKPHPKGQRRFGEGERR